MGNRYLVVLSVERPEGPRPGHAPAEATMIPGWRECVAPPAPAILRP